MKNSREARVNVLNNAGVDTSNFFNLNMDIPVGSSIQIVINGIKYDISSEKHENEVLEDPIAKNIVNNGYVFNSRVDGRWVVAQTFKMLTTDSYNFKTKTHEKGWDAYMRNCYPYMYQFDMMRDEVHKLNRMEQQNDPDFLRLSNFFTKEVIIETCKHYFRQLKKFVKKQKIRHCKGVPYIRLACRDTFIKDLNRAIYRPIVECICLLEESKNYDEIETNLKNFMKHMVKLPFDTPKCSAWKDAFKGKGAYVTLLNLVKFHDVLIVDTEKNDKLLDRDNSVDYIESLLVTYNGNYWKYHELLKQTIAVNDFDLRKSIEKNNGN